MHLNRFKCGGSPPAPYGLVLTHPSRLLGPPPRPLAPFLSQIARLNAVFHLLICLLGGKFKLLVQENPEQGR